jgi:hypothetical protein
MKWRLTTVADIETRVSTEYQYFNNFKQYSHFKHHSLWPSGSKDIVCMDIESLKNEPERQSNRWENIELDKLHVNIEGKLMKI